jgi:hypothetical protein
VQATRALQDARKTRVLPGGAVFGENNVFDTRAFDLRRVFSRIFGNTIHKRHHSHFVVLGRIQANCSSCFFLVL